MKGSFFQGCKKHFISFYLFLFFYLSLFAESQIRIPMRPSDKNKNFSNIETENIYSNLSQSLESNLKKISEINSSSVKCESNLDVYYCPSYYKKNYLDIYNTGYVGFLSLLAGEKNISNAMLACKSAAPNADFDYKKVQKQLQDENLLDPYFIKIQEQCQQEEVRGKTNSDLAKSYHALHYARSKESIDIALDDLLKMQADINLYAPKKYNTNCASLNLESSKENCNKLKGLSECKAEDLLNKEIDTNFSIFNTYLKAKKQNDSALVQALETSNPFLMGEHHKNMAKFYSKPSSKKEGGKNLDKEKYKISYLLDLEKQQKNINTKIEEMNSAILCLRAQKPNCDLEQTDKNIATANLIAGNRNKNIIPEQARQLDDYYQCTKQIKQARNEADEIIEPALLSSLFAGGPRIVMAGLNLTLKATKTTKGILQTKATQNSLNAGDAAATGYGAANIQQAFANCKNKHSEILQNQSIDNYNCNERQQVKHKLIDTSACTNEILVNIASVSPLIFSIKNLVKASQNLDSNFFNAIKNTDSATNTSPSSAGKMLNPEQLAKETQSFKTYAETSYSDEYSRAQTMLKMKSLTSNQELQIKSLVYENLQPAELKKKLKSIGLDDKQIDSLTKSDFFQLDPKEYERLSTRAPMNPSKIKAGNIVSISNEKGFLYHVRVDKIVDGKVYLKNMDNSSINKAFEKNEIYKSLSAGDEIIIKRKLGDTSIKQLVKIQSIDSNGMINIVYNNKPLKFSMAQLNQKPGSVLTTSKADLSPSLGPVEYSSLRLQINNIKKRFVANQNNPKLLSQNNKLMQDLQSSLRQQGISSSIVPSTDKPGFWNLQINGAHENGNKIARMYLRQANRVDAKSITVSMVDNLLLHSDGFRAGDGRVEIGINATLDMLMKNKNTTATHELRHQMLATDKEEYANSPFSGQLNSEASDLDLYGTAITDSKSINENFYSEYMSLEEFYTHSSDSSNIARTITDNTNSIKTSKLNQLADNISGLERIGANTKEVTQHILDNFDTSFDKAYAFRKDQVYLYDANNRQLSIHIDASTRQLLEGDTSSLKEVDYQNTLKQMQNLPADIQTQMNSHLNFVRKKPTEKQMDAYIDRLIDENKGGLATWSYFNEKLRESARNKAKESIRAKVMQIQSSAAQITQSAEQIQSQIANTNNSAQSAKQIQDKVSELRLMLRKMHNQGKQQIAY